MSFVYRFLFEHKTKFKVAVFCSSTFDKHFSVHANKLGSLIAQNNWTLLYGGGSSGLMGNLIEGAQEKNGNILGITIREFKTNVYSNIIALNLESRKTKFLDLSDAIVVLPGSIGTIDELFSALARLVDSINGFSKPIILVNINGYWNKLVKTVKFYNRKKMKLPFIVVKTPQQAIAILEQYFT